MKTELEKAAEKFANDCTLVSDAATYEAFIEGAKWQQERMYSEEDLRNAYRWGTLVNQGTKEHFNEWFEENKKK